MRALTILYGGSLAKEAFQGVFKGKSAFDLALERAEAFPGSEKTILLCTNDAPPVSAQKVSLIQRNEWTVSELLKVISEESRGFDFAYYAWADAPFLDADLAKRIAERHTNFAAEYSYADGWPYGLGPELINSASAGILYKIAAEAGEGPVKRDSLFTVLQKDINSFDIETEISSEDFRYHRLFLCADSKRNLLLLERFANEGCSTAQDAERVIKEHPAFLRTLPAFFPIQVSSACPPKGGSCVFCPYPRLLANNSTGKAAQRFMSKDFMPLSDFCLLLDNIASFCGDAVIDLSLWGELALHPQKEALIQAVLERPALSLIIETSGIGWGEFNLEQIAQNAATAKERLNGLPALSWIVSLAASDLPTADTEAVSFVKKLLCAFPKQADKEECVFIETIRSAGEEDAVEQFYRAWKSFAASGNHGGGPGIIIQKHDSFCGLLEQKQAVDLSPLERRPCWHLMRDFPVLIDGTVPLCREDLSDSFRELGNVFKQDLQTIWEKGEAFYLSHCEKNYEGPCGLCGEYYTFNF